MIIREDIDWPNMSNDEKISALLSVAEDYSRHFVESEALRRSVWDKYGFKVTAIKCSDSRPNLTKYAKLYEGEVYPIRAIGAKFDAGVPHFNDKLSSLIEWSINGSMRGHLIVVTAHFSRSTAHLCCAGFKNNTDAAEKAMIALRDQLWRMYRKWRNVVVVPIIMETDREEIILVGDNGERLSASECAEKKLNIRKKLRDMFPLIPEEFREYFRKRLIFRNFAHLEEVSANPPFAIALDHHEFMLGYGDGFMWTPGHRCLIINYFDLRPKPFFTGCDVIESVIKSGKNNGGWILNPSATYGRPEDIDRAIEQVRFLYRKAIKRIRENRRHLLESMAVLPTIVNRKTMKVEIIEVK